MLVKNQILVFIDNPFSQLLIQLDVLYLWIAHILSFYCLI